MIYTFHGKHFFFIKECSDMEQVKSTIARCKRTYKTQEYYVNRRIQKVTDSEGNIVYSGF